MFTTHSTRHKPPVSFAQLCSDIYIALSRYDTVLPIKQLLKIENHLCSQYGVSDFSVFNYDDDGNSISFVAFLDKHRHTIDPHGELSIYEHTTSTNNREELYSFVQQLSAINPSNTSPDEYQQQSSILIHGDVHGDQFHLSSENMSAIEKAVKHKFPEIQHFRQGNQIMRRIKQQRHRSKHPIIRSVQLLRLSIS